MCLNIDRSYQRAELRLDISVAGDAVGENWGAFDGQPWGLLVVSLFSNSPMGSSPCVFPLRSLCPKPSLVLLYSMLS